MKELKKLILHVDDDEDDLLLMEEALKEVNKTLEVVGARDGRQAIRYLEQGGGLPDLIILDINMPGMDGRETLSMLKKHNSWKGIPVVVFSTSSNPADKAYCASFDVDFVTKPMDMGKLRETARQMVESV